MTLLLLIFAQRELLSNAHLLLVGLALGIICSAIMTWAVYCSSSLDLRQLMYWMMGGFGGIDWRQQGWVLALLPIIGGCVAKGSGLILLRLASSRHGN